MRAEREHVETATGRTVVVKRFTARRFDVPWHRHPEVELTRIDRGAGQRMVGATVEPFGAGDLVLLGAGVPHTWRSETAADEVAATVVQFRVEQVQALAAAFAEATPVAAMIRRASGGLRFGAGSADAELDALVRDAAEGDAAAVPGRLLTLLARLASAAAEPVDAAPVTPLGEAAGARVEALTTLLQARFREGVSNAELAAAVHLSESAAARLFRRAMGQGFTDYLNSLRVADACRRLADTDAPVGDVALDSGFGNLSHFHRVFRQRVSQTPLQYRRSVQALRR